MRKPTEPGKKITRKKAKKSDKSQKPRKVSFSQQPDDLDLRNWQIALRRQYGAEQKLTISNDGDHRVFSDFTVSNPEFKSSYKVAIRSKDIGNNFCSCPDFRTNNLGTCKHIEAVLHTLKNTRGNKKYFKLAPPVRSYTSVFLEYGEERRVRIRIGTAEAAAFQALAKKYFDEEGILFPHAYLDFQHFLRQARDISPDFRCYPDALDYILEQREHLHRRNRLTELQQDRSVMADLIKTQLYPYQEEGVWKAVQAGRFMIADEMGLGKTLQAIAAAELMRKNFFIQSVVIICPTSLKYQWKSEIERFTESSVSVISGGLVKRRQQYETDDSFYKILTYNVVARDWEFINKTEPSLVILDEAQRIKNWNTKISRSVKRLQSPHCLVLTGTPLENKLEELYSVVQFVDVYRLGPLHQFLNRHQAKDETGRIVGYRDLGIIHQKLQPVMARRLKKEVIKQLPGRQDKHLFVSMTDPQIQMYAEYQNGVAQLVAKWRRFHFLSEKDRLRLLSFLNLMRMCCNSTFLVDQCTHFGNKMDELGYILEEYLADPDAKAVIFSQWERMTRLIAGTFEQQGIDFAYLHGGVPAEERGALLSRFREDPNCRVFLSTDAGGVGLNLQAASLVINMDIPWNPAVLEQRIARVYRLGQTSPVQVINMVSMGTIEQKMLSVLKFKSALADGVLDGGEDSIFMSESRFNAFMESVDEMTSGFEHAAETPDAESDLEVPQQEPAAPEAQPDFEEAEVPEEAAEAETSEREPANQEVAVGNRPTDLPKETPEQEPQRARQSSGGGAADLLQAGAQFLGALAQTLGQPEGVKKVAERLVEKDEKTGQHYLKVPVEGTEVVQKALEQLTSWLRQMS